MKKLCCKPVATGDFIQPPLCKNWTQEQFETHFDRLVEAGIDTLVVQWIGEVEEKKIRVLHHKSNLAVGDDSVEDCSSMLGNLLAAAKKKGISVFLGTPVVSGMEWWDKKFMEEEWREWVCNFTGAFMEEIYNVYYEEYKDVIAGWYWCQEMYTNNDNQEVYWVPMLNKDIEVMNRINPDLPMLMSPFFSQIFSSTPERIEEQWRYILDNTNFRPGDILCTQDSYGATSLPLSYIEEAIAAMKRASDANGKMKFWVNCESFNFNREETPGDISRFVTQLHVAAEYAEKIITFAYSHYYAAPTEKQKQNHAAYCQYVSRFI